MGKFI